MIAWRCYLCNHPDGLEFVSAKGECPRCGASGSHAVQKLVFVHLIYKDRNGPIVGQHGIRWRLACTPDRNVLAREGEDFSASDFPPAVTCPKCRQHKQFKASMEFYKIEPELSGGLKLDADGCC